MIVFVRGDVTAAGLQRSQLQSHRDFSIATCLVTAQQNDNRSWLMCCPILPVVMFCHQ